MPITCTVTGPACTRKVRDGRRATSKCAPPASSSKRMSASDSIALSSTVVGPSGTTREPSARTICPSASGSVPRPRQRRPRRGHVDVRPGPERSPADDRKHRGGRARRRQRRDATAPVAVEARRHGPSPRLRAAGCERGRGPARRLQRSLEIPRAVAAVVPLPALLSHDRALPSPPAGHERSSAWPSVSNSRTVWPRLRFAPPRGSGGSRRCARSRPRPRAPRGPP